jgi:hypothetical protein
MRKDTKLSSIADKLVAMLKLEGFVIQRYNAYSTNSIYLKLDYGVCNSIRISDHKGKAGLAYKYNLLSMEKEVRKERVKGEYEYMDRYYYPITQTQSLVSLIKRHKESRIAEIGEPVYRVSMRQMLIKHRDDKGFWSQSFIV